MRGENVCRLFVRLNLDQSADFFAFFSLDDELITEKKNSQILI